MLVQHGHLLLQVLLLSFEHFQPFGQGGVSLAVPVDMRIVKMQPDTLLAASLRQFAQHIAAERGGIDDVVVGKGGIEHGESLVVARGEADIPCP